MSIRARLMKSVLCLGAGLFSVVMQAEAQPYGGQHGPVPPGVAQAGPFVPGGPGGQFVDAYGNPAIVPASYAHGGAYGGPYGGGVDPFAGAGVNVEQTGPHFFDISADFIYWQRDTLGSQSVAFSSDGVGVTSADLNIVQTSGDLDPDFEPGFRLAGRYDIGALSVIEATYTGLLNQSQSSTVTPQITDFLFSPFTNFGVDTLDNGDPNPFANGLFPLPPPPGTEPDLDNFDETDFSTSHSLSFDSNLQSAELSYRRYWVGRSPRLTGTLLAGFRYTRLDEALRFTTVGSNFAPGSENNAVNQAARLLGTVPISTSTFEVEADNNLTGFQLGGDASYAVRQGIRFLAEGKVGIYNNDIRVGSTFTTDDNTPGDFALPVFNENQVAFISDARLTLIVDVLPSLSLKAGYEVLFLNSIATSVDNLDFAAVSDVISGLDTAPAAVLNDQSDAVFHGAHFGLEYIW